jgi:hypothetical protein
VRAGEYHTPHIAAPDDVTLPLTDLQPGAKRIRVRVSDSTNVSEREVGFVVK